MDSFEYFRNHFSLNIVRSSLVRETNVFWSDHNFDALIDFINETRYG